MVTILKFVTFWELGLIPRLIQQ